MLDKQPQPIEDAEIIAGQEIIKQMHEIAKMFGGDRKPSNGESPPLQFGNNFFMLFCEGDDRIDNSMIEKMLEIYPDKWNNFLNQNADLVSEIKELIKQKEQGYDTLRMLLVKLMRNPKGLSTIDQVIKEIDADSFGIEVWNKLNPLLKRANDEMIACGIKPEEFYGQV